MKGAWLPALVKRCLEGFISWPDGIRFARWRLHPTETIRLCGLIFSNADHTTWSLIAETFLLQEYTPKGFSFPRASMTIDIGAHRGIFTGFTSLKSSGPIFALEPDPENFHALEVFIATNGIKITTPMNCALASRDGTTKLYHSLNSRHSITGIDQATGERLSTYRTLPCISLNTLLEPFTTIVVLKLDCEGAEYEILDATDISHLQKTRFLTMEVHDLINKKNSYEALVTKLKASFEVVQFRRKTAALGLLTAENY